MLPTHVAGWKLTHAGVDVVGVLLYRAMGVTLFFVFHCVISIV